MANKGKNKKRMEDKGKECEKKKERKFLQN